MKNKILMLSIIFILLLTIVVICNKTAANEDADIVIEDINTEQLIATNLGIGGGGALFEPKISPHNANEMLVIPDMGGIYISHDKGLQWHRENLYGTVITAEYDPNREGVLYAGGSGLYRSMDNGDSFELLFPKQDDLLARMTTAESGLQYLFTKSGQYPYQKNVKDILIDPEDSNHIFVLFYKSKSGAVYESIDNGETFTELFSYTKTTNKAMELEFNELIYKRESKELFVINNEKIIKYNSTDKTSVDIYLPTIELVDVATVCENGKTYFIIIEKTDELANSDTKVYYTNNFVDKVDITTALTSVQPTTFTKDGYGDVTYKYNFNYIDATSLNNIYITNRSYAKSATIKPYGYSIDAVIRYHDNEVKYLYGNPFRNHNYLASRSWNDGNTFSFGIAASKHSEEEFIFTTLCGVYYSADTVNIYPRQTTVTEGAYPNGKYVTNGIDEQTTYGVKEDPYHENVLFLLNTDLGLIKSEDNGASWVVVKNGIPTNWSGNVYDLVFDERKENQVYSIWSSRHDVPYSPGNETDGKYGGFAISKDGGNNWDSTYSAGLPENAIPVKMSVVYPSDSSEATIYVATYNYGFFKSTDSGKTFATMNDGIEKVTYLNSEQYKYILAADIEVKDGHIFGMTAKSTYQEATQPGAVYEYINDSWNKIELPENVITPRDIYYKDGVLYVAGTATPLWDHKNGLPMNNYGGGIYAYKNGQFSQIFDESISTTGIQIDSKGTIFISDLNGNIYRKPKDENYQKIYDSYHYSSKGIQLTENGDKLYLSAFGGGVLRLENLNSLYSHECTGGTATCIDKAICDICGEEYGELDRNNHVSDKTYIVNKLDAYCEEDGYTGDVIHYCCGGIKELGSVIEKFGHRFNEGEIILEPTYNEAGEKMYVCEICSDSKIEIIPKLENGEDPWAGILRGDLNGDGKITSVDLAQMLRGVVDMPFASEEAEIAADINQDGNINATDLSLLKMMLVGLVIVK